MGRLDHQSSKNRDPVLQRVGASTCIPFHMGEILSDFTHSNFLNIQIAMQRLEYSKFNEIVVVICIY